jgi:hypothetical protein
LLRSHCDAEVQATLLFGLLTIAVFIPLLEYQLWRGRVHTADHTNAGVPGVSIRHS